MVKNGDRVQIDEAVSNYYSRCGIVTYDNACMAYPYRVKFDDGDECIFRGSDLIVLSIEEEKVMKFKVGDKVKVKDSWEGRDGEIGQIVDINVHNEFTHEVRFEDMVAECFREEELELVKEKAEKQSFTKSDLKTGMGVVLRNGDKAHVLLGTDDGDVMRFLGKGTWDELDSTNEDLTWKGSDKFDIVEVYSTALASRYLTDMVFEEKCVFKREEPKPEPTKMTMKEINEHFGKAIEIVE